MSQRTGRRVFLKLASAAAGALTIAGCEDGDEAQPPATGAIVAGKANEIAPNSIVGVGEKPVVIARDAKGLYAMSTICTHEGCNIRRSGTITATGLNCQCHGSKYDANGNVTEGPATKTLDHYKVEVAADGTVTIQASQIVDKDARTPVG